MMKKTVWLFVFVIISNVSCSTTVVHRVQSSMQGHWQWVRSTGGYAGKMMTPDSTGASGYIITFDKSHKYSYQRADTVYRSGFYTLNKRDGAVIIRYKTGADKFFPDQRVRFESNDTLILADECADCYTNVYTRIH